MRRALQLGAAGVTLAAAVVLAVVLSAVPEQAATPPQITRLFIPAIKAACLHRADVSADRDLGYDFTVDGALVTIDRDGSLTGLPAYTLFVLNSCLDDYPIEPPRDLPRDRYSRNLLYDYFGGVLRPCLESRAGDLPVLPTRADFVERLYRWDPYRSLAPGRPLNELLTLASECPALPPYLIAD